MHAANTTEGRSERLCLPSLDLLKSFVAVGRRLSITLAAEDLYLTQSAVSRQIQALEDAVGCKLLVRGHRALRFTVEGETLFREAERALERLQDAVASLRPINRPVTVNASIGVTALWLLPRLARLQQAHPDIEVRVTAMNRIVDLDRETVDLGIRYCRAEHAPAGALRLFGEHIAVVAHPSLGLSRISTPNDLEDRILLEYDDPLRPWLQWGPWLERHGWQNLRPRGILRFNQYDQAILAALGGQGIALGRLPLLEQQVREGLLLVVPAGAGTITTDYAYWLMHGDARPRSAVVTVADWIRSESACKADLSASAAESGAGPR